jgi:phosphoribosylaminoimidazolecarboxamide formyltransferase / IMP cyclohydrolase
VISEISENGNTTLATRFRLAVKVFQLTSTYDTAIAAWLAKVDTNTNAHFKGGE